MDIHDCIDFGDHKDKTLKEFFDTHKGEIDSFSHNGMKYEYIQYSDKQDKEAQISMKMTLQ